MHFSLLALGGHDLQVHCKNQLLLLHHNEIRFLLYFAKCHDTTSEKSNAIQVFRVDSLVVQCNLEIFIWNAWNDSFFYGCPHHHTTNFHWFSAYRFVFSVHGKKKTFGSLYVKETFAIFETLINVEKHKYDVITGETTFFSIYRWNSFFVVAQFKRQLCTWLLLGCHNGLNLF